MTKATPSRGGLAKPGVSSSSRIKPGDGEQTARERLGRARRLNVGGSTWYATPKARSRLLVRVQAGKVREIGIGDASLTRTIAQLKRFLRAWPLG